jgi:hypothetical protein
MATHTEETPEPSRVAQQSLAARAKQHSPRDGGMAHASAGITRMQNRGGRRSRAAGRLILVRTGRVGLGYRDARGRHNDPPTSGLARNYNLLL